MSRFTGGSTPIIASSKDSASTSLLSSIRQVSPGGWSPRRPQPERSPRTRKGSGVANFQVSVASATLGPSSEGTPAWSVTEQVVSNGNGARGLKVTERLPAPSATAASKATACRPAVSEVNARTVSTSTS